MKKILFVIGARPQFIKHAPVELAFRESFNIVTIHTGQHYDKNMSQIFFDELSMNKPDYLLETGGYGHGVQTGKMLIEMEPIVIDENPDVILVYGDTNSTLAGALIGAKLHIPVVHVEAGLRSFNKKMPEEINRIMTDHASSVLLVPTQNAIDHLKNEGITDNVYHTGDVMCDLIRLSQDRNLLTAPAQKEYYYATIHRPYNTDDVGRLKSILDVFNELDAAVVFSIHPRTRNKMIKRNLLESDFPNIDFIDPVSYFQNISYQAFSKAVITDSGGMQKEAYLLKKKCITIRTETEWTETLENNWNNLVFENLNDIPKLLQLSPGDHKYNIYGSGRGAYEMRDIIEAFLSARS